jgi:phytoene dehydrogenase-like protein
VASGRMTFPRVAGGERTLEQRTSERRGHSVPSAWRISRPKRGAGSLRERCRVHGLANLYIAGASVYPTGGCVNPTLTLVALAIRLADHLKGAGA